MDLVRLAALKVGVQGLVRLVEAYATNYSRRVAQVKGEPLAFAVLKLAKVIQDAVDDCSLVLGEPAVRQDAKPSGRIDKANPIRARVAQDACGVS